MASRDQNSKKSTIFLNPKNLPCNNSFLFLTLLCFGTLYLLFSALKNSNKSFIYSIDKHANLEFKPPPSSSSSSSSVCNYTKGSWIYDPNGSTKRYDNTCKEIFKGWNCISSNKSNAAGFVGDSLNRNMFVSLVCSLKKVSNEVKKWRPAGSDRGYTFLKYNLTVAYHRTNLLARYGRWRASESGGVLESLGYKEGFRVDVDVPEGTWAEAPSFHDILILNTGHWWWAPSKFDPIKSPMLFFEKGLPVIPPIRPDFGLDMVLSNMAEELFSLENNGTNVETRLVNQHLYRVLKTSSFQVLDITGLSELRADAHPSTASGKKHVDCMHWCLPGITDSWNDLLMAYLSDI
ncbi:hypothetical protein MKX01_004375 [Papaver californicum]|nr:hypothetical protein MKX01_004375 [Papaver californicum]